MVIAFVLVRDHVPCAVPEHQFVHGCHAGMDGDDQRGCAPVPCSQGDQLPGGRAGNGSDPAALAFPWNRRPGGRFVSGS
jgi:hypothetical protein